MYYTGYTILIVIISLPLFRCPACRHGINSVPAVNIALQNLIPVLYDNEVSLLSRVRAGLAYPAQYSAHNSVDSNNLFVILTSNISIYVSWWLSLRQSLQILRAFLFECSKISALCCLVTHRRKILRIKFRPVYCFYRFISEDGYRLVLEVLNVRDQFKSNPWNSHINEQ